MADAVSISLPDSGSAEDTAATPTHTRKDQCEPGQSPSQEPRHSQAGPVFPDDAYVGLAGDFAALYSQETEAPKSFLFMAFLSYLGAVISPQVTLDSALHPQPRLYTVLLGASAETRKSSSLGFVEEFFREVISDYPVHHGIGSAEGLAVRLHEHNTLLLHLDELQTLVGKAKAKGSIVLPFLTTLFEENAFDNTTKTHSVSVRDAHLSLIGACTTDTYAKMWTSQFLEIGFLNRLFLVTGEPLRRVALPGSIPPAEVAGLKARLRTLLDEIGNRSRTLEGWYALRLTEDAKAAWDDWYQRMPRDEYVRRLDTYGWRLMILFSLVGEELSEVSVDTVRRVCNLLDYEYATRRAFDPVDAENQMARMEELIRRTLRKRGPLGERDLRRYANADKYGVWYFRNALQNLKDVAGDVRQRKSGAYELVEEH